jgi:hypothetical protein
MGGPHQRLLMREFTQRGSGLGQRECYSTVTLLARLRGWSTSVPLMTAM